MGELTTWRKIRLFGIKNSHTNTPIFALTADEQAETLQAAEAAGANGFLNKPLDPHLLLKIIAKVG